MNRALRNAIVQTLERFETKQPEAYAALFKAWNRTVNGTAYEGARRLIPLVGSGLNNMIPNGLGSWGALVKKIQDACNPRWHALEIERAKLNYPQRLELYLSECPATKRYQVATAFRDHFGKIGPKHGLHRRLLQLFPHIATTNYDLLLEAPGPGRPVFDLTDPEVLQRDPFLRKSAILYLHGRWNSNESHKDQERRIFGGIDFLEDHKAPLLVLSESQYHHLYAHRLHFQQSVRTLFASENLLLFVGLGLSSDESGIHTYLRDLSSSGLREPIGISVNFDLRPAKAAFLRARGIATISLPSHFGWAGETRLAVYQTFLDELLRRFKTPEAKHKLQSMSLKRPDVLCVGLSSKQTVISLTVEPKPETSYPIPNRHLVEEPGGQHLAPALHLARKGYYVGLATRLGDDITADWVVGEVRAFVENREKCDGDIDTRLLLFSSDGTPTRRTYAINYPTGKKFKGIKSGSRVIYDQDRTGTAPIKWLRKKADRDQFRERVAAFGRVDAIYIGPYGPDARAILLKKYATARFRFLETGTAGSGDPEGVLRLATKCTHVISSAKFIFWCLDRRKQPNDDFQKKLYTLLASQESAKKWAEKLKSVHRQMFSSKTGHLIVTLGVYGAAYVGPKNEPTLIPLNASAETRKQVAWIGCGDIFRAEFIAEVLRQKKLGQNIDLIKACKSANRVAFERTMRVSFI